MSRLWSIHQHDILLGSGASLAGYLVTAPFFGGYPRSLRGWGVLLLIAVLVGCLFSARFFFRSLLPVSESQSA